MGRNSRLCPSHPHEWLSAVLAQLEVSPRVPPALPLLRQVDRLHRDQRLRPPPPRRFRPQVS